MKTLILKFLVWFLILNSNLDLFSQEISFNTIFTGDTTLFPFERIERISSLTVEGEVHLHHETSLVRLIMEDISGYQYMILEAYPLICEDSVMTFYNHCDETCIIGQIQPYSLIIQVIDGYLSMKTLYYETELKENAETERYSAKRKMDENKISMMNRRIPEYGMNWTAGDNEVAAMYYEQKRPLFGDGYNLLGYDYYYNGVFEFLGHGIYQMVSPDIVREFDWRNRHGINDSTSGYWDGDEDKAGWLTGAKDQKNCGSCWAFSSAGTAEAIANLYAARTLDYDLSEQDLLCHDNSANDCGGSFNDFSGLIYIKNTGVVFEECYPYDTIEYYNSCATSQPCQNPDSILKIFDTLYFKTQNEKDFDNIREALITKGPLKISYSRSTDAHAVVLTGYKFNIKDSTLTFIIKDSHGNGGPNKGFMEINLDSINYALAVITPVYKNDTALSVSCNDFDNDGHCFWGIGQERPSNCPCQCDTIEDCDDNNPFVGGYDENYNCSCNLVFDTVDFHITEDTTWSDTAYVNYQVVIDSGACLTIRSYAAFSPEAGIQVKQGGKLILDSAYLTKVCPELWQGIEVLGSDTIQSLDRYFGKVTVENNSIIEFARIAIANCRTQNEYFWTQSGGIILIENAVLRDNETDIMLAPFSTYWFGHDLPYVCSLSNSQFITTNNFYPDFVPYTHIDITDIYGITITGCKFENQTNPHTIPYQIRGTGISSKDSYFDLVKRCTSQIVPCEEYDSCRFTRLEYGVRAMNSRSKRTLRLEEIVFDSNFLAISLSGLEYASVLSNNFKCPKSIEVIPENRFTGGLFMEGCTGYHVENNVFNPKFSSSEGGKSPCYGIGVKNSGPDDNEIYNNSFERLSAGIYAIGVNRGRESGLCLKCNDMVSNLNDFIVVDVNDPPLGTYQGINRYQGDPVDSTSYSAPAGNIFSDDFGHNAILESLKYYNYFNSGEDIRYTHHAENINYLLYPLDSNYTDATIELKEWTTLRYEKDSACPSGLGGGVGLKSYYSPRSIINEADIQIDILRAQLSALVDGGNTEELSFEVMTSMPDDGLEIRQDLLTASPYLSDTILKQAIYKEDVLPNAMIRDILEVNPQSAKSDDILYTLDSRYEPMPDYMMAQILQGKKYLGSKEILEAKIQSWSQIRSKAKAELMSEFMLDTNVISPIDSVITFLENETDLDSRYELALAQWANSDQAGTWETLNTIPTQIALNDHQIIEHENYLQYFGILQSLADSNWQVNQLDSTSVALLFEIKETGNSRIAALSRGLLVRGEFYKYIETVNYPNMTKSSMIYQELNKEKSKQKITKKLWLFPNPAADFVIAYYDLDPIYNIGEILLFDLKGNLLKNFKISSGKNQIVIDLTNYPNSYYIISLSSKNKILYSEKLNKGGH